MSIHERTPLADVAIAVGDALRKHGIRGVLTGGACASLHSNGAYVSRDVDYILPAETRLSAVDKAMLTIGFTREGDRYVHAKCRFFVEFPAGPLAIGSDMAPRPVMVQRGRTKALTLSATDACRDRLAAFYHWGDRQALQVAVEIAKVNRVGVQRIRAWSAEEGAAEKFDEFLRAVLEARRC